jgi:hypothetical protein
LGHAHPEQLLCKLATHPEMAGRFLIVRRSVSGLGRVTQRRDDKERGPHLLFSRCVARCLPVSDLPDGQKSFARENLSSPVCKKNPLRQRPKSDLKIPPSRSERGALAIVTNVGPGCGGRGSAGRADVIAGRALARERTAARRRTAMLPSSLKLRSRAHTPKPLGEDGSRTVKPCGPGTRCWCQVGGGFTDPTGFRKTVNSPTTVTKRNSSPGRARSKPLKPLRRECRLIPVNLWRRPCAFFCTRAAGASDTRHSLRPLF